MKVHNKWDLDFKMYRCCLAIELERSGLPFGRSPNFVVCISYYRNAPNPKK